jgi:hypothetical protein
MAGRRSSGIGVEYDDDDTPEIKIRLGKRRGKKKDKGCAKVKVEFGDGSTRFVRICEDGIEEYTED